MATTTGLVQKVTLFGNTAGTCVFIGPLPSSVEVFLIQLQSTDTDAVRAFKNAMLTLIVSAEQAGYPVTVDHQDGSAEIERVSVGGFNISPTGPAVHGDFYSVSGSEIPSDAVIAFDSQAVIVRVTPDLVRSHWVFVKELPSAIPVGRNTVQLQAPGWSSDAVPIDVIDSPKTTVRTLYSGAPKTSPYTIVFVANPAMLGIDGTISPDPVLRDRPGFHGAVAFCLKDLFAITEDLLRRSNLDANIRLVAIFDATLAANDASALAKNYIHGDFFETRRDKLSSFLFGYFEVADVVFVLSGLDFFYTPRTWMTTDDNSRPGTRFTYDLVPDVHHRHFASIPGSVVMPLFNRFDPPFDASPAALHEFGHAASDDHNGFVGDLWDPVSNDLFHINKKWGRPIPAIFASYELNTYASDPNRNSLGYEFTWTLYHPQLIDSTFPNIMDNFGLAPNSQDPLDPPGPQMCRFDKLTYAWLTDRIKAKLLR